MKVLYIQDIGDKGGATNSLKEMVLNLSLNFNVTPVIITSDRNSVNEFADKNNFENYAVNHRQLLVPASRKRLKNIIKKLLKPFLYLLHHIYNLKAMKFLEKNIDFSTIDIIHTNVNRNDLGLMICKKYNIPHVMHIREFSDLDYQCIPLSRNYIKYMNTYTDRFIAISKVISEHWQKKGIDSNKIQVVYNGVIVPTEITKDTNDKIKMIFSGQICNNKGQIQVLKALSNIKPNLLNKLQLDIFGDGDVEYINYLKKFVKSNGLEHVVNFRGFNSKLSDIISQYDIGFVCSKAEAFGRVTVEYMLSKVCVIASDTGANLEIIEDNVNGIIYHYDDIDDLSNKIINVANSKDLRTKLSMNAYIKSNERFTSTINVKNMYDMYIDLLKRGTK